LVRWNRSRPAANKRYSALKEAIQAGDIYQANLYLPKLAGSYRAIQSHCMLQACPVAQADMADGV
jgi:hypothetical protein